MMTRFGQPLSPMTRIGRPIAPMTHMGKSARPSSRYPYEAGSKPALALVFSLLAFFFGVLVLL